MSIWPPALEADLTGAFGALEWDKHPRTARDAESLFPNVGADVTIKFQLVDTIGRARWPSEGRAVLQRYSDAPPATLQIPTAPAGVAMKPTAWVDRRTRVTCTTCGR